jgi:O-acetylhomoserine/O-acetylserine sulfhydrylase-like pyridoxal-dependent enzyme
MLHFNYCDMLSLRVGQTVDDESDARAIRIYQATSYVFLDTDTAMLSRRSQ